MKRPNRIINIIAVWTFSLFIGCHSSDKAKQAGVGQKIEPPLPLPYFFASDTLVKTAPADTMVYGIIKAALSDPHLLENTKATRFCDVSLAESRYAADFTEPLNKHLISADDTIGLKDNDTNHYRLDWAKLNGRKSITVKEVVRGFNRIVRSGALDHFPDPAELERLYTACFHCNVLASVSYPRINKHGDLAVVEMSESFNFFNSGSCFYFLKKHDGKWKLIFIQTGWVS